ncbi:MAG: hypothetical protein IPL61_01000 [Myxococcales bacterium]|nr:hypothetical protein [Myxococcales bacterium]
MPSASLDRARLPRLTALAAVLLFGACPRPAPTRPAAVAQVAWGVDGRAALAGVAIVGDVGYLAGGRTLARVDGGAPTWSIDLPADGGAVAATDALVAVAVAGTGPLDGLPLGLRGEPGAAIIARAARDGAARWLVGVGATEWVTVRALVARGDGFALAGTFAGTLRIGDHVLTSAGSADGFWAVLGADGAVRTVHRMGGAGADAVAGIAGLADGTLAIAGTYAGPAELDDAALPALYDTDAADGFVAVVTDEGAMVWARTWGGPTGDACAGVVATADGVAVAGTVRGVADVAGRRVEARGAADGLVTYFDARGSVRATVIVGGADFDGVTAIAGHGDDVVVGGWFSGTLAGPAAALVAIGGDDPMVARVRPEGVVALTALASPGAATIPAIAADDRGWLVALTSATAARFADAAVPAGASARASRW